MRKNAKITAIAMCFGLAIPATMMAGNTPGITSQPFGKTPSGERVELFTLLDGRHRSAAAQQENPNHD